MIKEYDLKKLFIVLLLVSLFVGCRQPMPYGVCGYCVAGIEHDVHWVSASYIPECENE